MDILLQTLTVPAKIPLGIAIAGAVAVIAYFLKRKKKKAENEYHALYRIREDALERALANPMQKESGRHAEMQRRPFRVEYSNGDDDHKRNEIDTMLQLTESTELSQRKYMFRCRELISIGTRLGKTAILSDTSEPGQICCQIFFYEGANYVRSINRKDIFLVRRGKTVAINDLGIKLLSNDSFTVDGTTFQIDFL